MLLPKQANSVYSYPVDKLVCLEFLRESGTRAKKTLKLEYSYSLVWHNTSVAKAICPLRTLNFWNLQCHEVFTKLENKLKDHCMVLLYSRCIHASEVRVLVSEETLTEK